VVLWGANSFQIGEMFSRFGQHMAQTIGTISQTGADQGHGVCDVGVRGQLPPSGLAGGKTVVEERD